MSEYVEKLRVNGHGSRAPGEPIGGGHRCSSRRLLGATHAGPETLLELLDSRDRLPAVRASTADDAIVLALPAWIIQWVMAGPGMENDLVRRAPRSATRARSACASCCAAARSFDGLIQMELPEHLNRISDYLNGPETLLPAHEPGSGTVPDPQGGGARRSSSLRATRRFLGRRRLRPVVSPRVACMSPGPQRSSARTFRRSLTRLRFPPGTRICQGASDRMPGIQPARLKPGVSLRHACPVRVRLTTRLSAGGGPLISRALADLLGSRRCPARSSTPSTPTRSRPPPTASPRASRRWTSAGRPARSAT